MCANDCYGAKFLRINDLIGYQNTYKLKSAMLVPIHVPHVACMHACTWQTQCPIEYYHVGVLAMAGIVRGPLTGMSGTTVVVLMKG